MKSYDATSLSQEEETRYWANIKKTPKCWNWLGKKTDYGVGKFYIVREDDRGRKKVAQLSCHRLAYSLEYGPLDKNIFIKPTCDNMACVNPEHLISVTQSEYMALKKQGSLK